MTVIKNEMHLICITMNVFNVRKFKTALLFILVTYYDPCHY